MASTREWSGGVPYGSIHKDRECYVVTFSLKGEVEKRSFAPSKYHGPERALAAATAWRLERSSQLGLTTNQYRSVTLEDGAECIEVRLRDGTTFLVSPESLDLVTTRRWYPENAGYVISKDGVLLHRFLTRYTITDHINKNKRDNRLCNLREASVKLNNNNKSRSCLNKSGKTGIYKSGGKWTASWHTPLSVRKTRSFSISKYGEDRARELAAGARIEAEKLYNINNE